MHKKANKMNLNTKKSKKWMKFQNSCGKITLLKREWGE
ncbi:hypothetical protein RU97_GL002609 [Enterococcus canis]|uniref:Uncharacterized protein n=1 Tax=Enterococcus canis TaxID=214095 RepID=A0A1L8RCV9_9ENTE|nr:hypothetical protein RU97_GL002609 [Enterococcus canis]